MHFYLADALIRHQNGVSMIALYLAPLYLLLNIYLVFRAARWLSLLHPALGNICFLIPLCLCFALVILSPLPAAFDRGKRKVISKKISSWWLGTLIYLMIFLLVSECFIAVYHLAWGRPPFSAPEAYVLRISDTLVAVGTLLLSLYGTHNARNIRRTVYPVTICKACGLSSLKIALVADLHLGGAVGLHHMRKVCAELTRIQPDLLIFAGDIFDNDFGAIDAPEEICAMLRNIPAKYGAYACWGNHDIEEVILAGFTFSHHDQNTKSSPEMKKFLRDAGIRVLEDETILVDNQFYLCGRLDASCKEKSGTIRLTPSELTTGLDHSRPILVMDHQPSELQELAEAGVDLDLSGHTHDGQIFPLTLTSRLLWKNSRGLMRLGNMTSIVTSGAGIWGPSQRIGSHSEIVEVNVKFQTPDNA